MTGPAHLARQPVSLRSRVVRRPDRPYTEVDGHPMVIVTERRAAIEIAAGALPLWAALDGRPLGDLLAHLDPDRTPIEYVELVRRWRALGVVEERDVLEAGPAPSDFDSPVGGADSGVGGADPPAPGTGSHVPGAGPAAALTWRPFDSSSPAPPTDDDPVAWFAALLGWVADDELHRSGLADALAWLAEQPDARAALAARLCGPRG